MLKPIDLIDGKVYFLLLYYDSSLKVPHVETHIYIKEVNNIWLFKDPAHYFKCYEQQDTQQEEEEGILEADEDVLSQMYTLKGLIVELEKLNT